jgi:pullulanase
LVGLLDADTINSLVDAVHEKFPEIIFYGEGWTMNTAVDPNIKMATQLNARLTPDFAYFSDTIRDVLAGRNGETLGFVSGSCGQEEPLSRCFTAKTSWCPKPTQTVNYASCHDNYTLFDKLSISRKDASRADLIRMNKLAAAIYMTAQGIPFIHAGEEFLREKLDANGKRIENSYNSPDFVNKIRWSLLEQAENAAVTEYYKGLIRFRKAHAALRLSTAEKVAANVTYRWITNEVVLFDISGSVDGEASDGIVVIFNATDKAQSIDLAAAGVSEGIWDVFVNAAVAGTEILDTVTDGQVHVDPVSVLVLCKR